MDLHIAWDIGVADLGARLARALDACFIRQTYSRLVIDCNRRPGEVDSVPEVSDGVAIPGNRGLGPTGLAERVTEIYEPYQHQIARVLDRRQARRQRTFLVSLHSFTPMFQGASRPRRFGVLHRNDSALSQRVLVLLRKAVGDDAGDNQPYAMNEIDNTVPLHADPRRLDYLELEVRQDLIAKPEGARAVASMLANLLIRALPPNQRAGAPGAAKTTPD
jgi:predicted N-formylglutamate amidohydrolase